MGIFDLNEEAVVICESFMGSNLYYIDDFYKNPDDIAELFNIIPNCVYRPGIEPNAKSLNGIYFDDRREFLKTDEIIHVWKHLSNIIGYHPLSPHKDCRDVITNQFRYRDKSFNKSKDNYWHPHTDSGFNAIVYFNKNDDICGTNLYKLIHPDLPISKGEHAEPWRSKKNWERISTLKPAFNRCVIFDGGKFHHGMDISNDRYSGEEYRLNQIFFFENESSST
jgi:hypothetical protein